MPDPTPEHAECAQDLAADLLRATDPLDRKQAAGAIARALADAEERGRRAGWTDATRVVQRARRGPSRKPEVRDGN